jgi:GAF domain-containing protein
MSDSMAACEAELERLLIETGASRTTLRMEADDGWLPVVGEALGEGVGSLRGVAIDVRSAATFQALDRDRGLLVQDDLTTSDPPPPPELIEVYGAKAQMLAPLERDGRVVGVISVHEARGPRPWRQSDRDALIRATAAIAAELGVEHGVKA